MPDEPLDEPLLRLAAVTKRFGGERPVLEGIDLTIARGERVALLGESGSGKSTLLNLIAGLEPIDAGEICVDGQWVHRLDEASAARLRRASIGFVFQAFHLLPQLDARHNVALPLLLNGQTQRVALERADASLHDVGLSARRQAMPAELSGGEQQRVALVRALIHGPSLVLADEPTGNLDPATAAQALQLIESQVARSGAALLMVTHSDQAAAIATRRLWLGQRRLIELDPATPLHDAR